MAFSERAELIPTAVFRADASTRLGGGHVMRCLALADALRDVGWRSLFAGQPETIATATALADAGHGWHPLVTGCENDPAATVAAAPDGCDLLVVDHYDLDIGFEGPCRPWAKRIMIIDDLANRTHDGDFLIDQTLGRPESEYRPFVPESCRLLLGPDYALLRPQFAAARRHSLARRGDQDGIKRVLISFGAGDPDNLTARALTGLAAARFEGHADVVLGKGAPHLETIRAMTETLDFSASLHVAIEEMARLMADADLAIGAGGTTSWERCCLGLPALIAVIAANQQMIAAELGRAGAAVVLGRHGDVNADTIAGKFAEIAANSKRLAAMSTNAAAVCDGLGTARVREALAA